MMGNQVSGPFSFTLKSAPASTLTFGGLSAKDQNGWIMSLEPQNHFLSYFIIRCMSDDKKVIVLRHAQHNFCRFITDNRNYLVALSSQDPASRAC